MPAPFTQVFEIGGFKTTSVVIDQADFDAFVDELAALELGGQRMSANMLANLRAAKHLPMMARGTKTQVFFDRWGVTTDKLSVIVRGHGRQLAKDLGVL